MSWPLLALPTALPYIQISFVVMERSDSVMYSRTITERPVRGSVTTPRLPGIGRPGITSRGSRGTRWAYTVESFVPAKAHRLPVVGSAGYSARSKSDTRGSLPEVIAPALFWLFR